MNSDAKLAKLKQQIFFLIFNLTNITTSVL